MPTTRIGLYRNYLRLLLELREGDKALQGTTSTAHPADSERRKWLGCLELLLKLSPEQREMARRARCSADFMPDASTAHARGRPCSELLHEDADFAKWWEDRKLCRLGHESLHEFLAAGALARLYQGDPKGFWKGWLHPNIFDPYWQQTLIFAIALMSKGDQTSLMNGLLKLGSCDPVSELTKRHLEVIAKAWGAGVRYDQAIWEEWLYDEPQPDLLVTAAANASLRIAALEALEQMALEGEDEGRKLLAAYALAKFNPKLVVSIFQQLALGAEDEHVRSGAAKFLLLRKPAVAIQALMELAQSAKDTGIQLSSAVLLEPYYPKASLQTFMRLAQEAEYEFLRNLSAEAAEALITGRPPQAFGRKVGTAGNKVTVRALARREWAKLEAESTVPTLEQYALSSADKWLQLISAVMLAEHGLDTGISTLRRLARKAKNKDLQFMATRALIEFGPKLAISTFEQLAMSSAEEQVRFEAAKALVDLNPEVAIFALEKLAQETEDEWMRSSAVSVLGGLGPEAIPTLEKLAQETEDERVRYAAAKALEELGAPPLGCETLD